MSDQDPVEPRWRPRARSASGRCPTAAAAQEAVPEPEDRPRDEREFSTELEIKTPYLPLVNFNFAVKFRRLWDKRAVRLLQDAADFAGKEAQHLIEELENPDSAFPDLTGRIAARCQERGGDPIYRSALSRLIAAALHDSARIDEVAYIADRIMVLDPVHIRVMILLPYETIAAASAAQCPLAFMAFDGGLISDDRGIHLRRPRPSQGTSLGPLSADGYGRALKIGKHVVESVFNEIEDVGFLTSSESGSEVTFNPTGLGLMAAHFINTEANSARRRGRDDGRPE